MLLETTESLHFSMNSHSVNYSRKMLQLVTKIKTTENLGTCRNWAQAQLIISSQAVTTEISDPVREKKNLILGSLCVHI